MYNVLNICVEIIIILGEGCCLQYFLGNFLESRSEKWYFSKWMAVAGYCVLKMLLYFMISSGNGNIGAIIKLILTLVGIFCLSFICYKGFRTITAYLAVTFLAVREISFFLSFMILQMSDELFDLWGWLMEENVIASDKVYEVLVKGTVVGTRVLYCIAYIVLMRMVLKKIIKCFRDKEHEIQRTELYFLLVPGLVGMLLGLMLRILMITVENNETYLLYDRYPILAIIVSAILVLSLLSIIYEVKVFEDMNVLHREKSNRIILEKQIDTMQEHMAEMERIYSGVRSLKHDMKNTLAVAMQLAEEKKCREGETHAESAENSELQNYLNELNRTMEKLDFRFRTGNNVADTLLNMKYHEAVCSMSDLEMDADRLLFSEDMLIHGFDIGIILGNALDNAIEACKKLKEKEPNAEVFIRLNSFQRGKMFFLEIENSFDGKIKRIRSAELPKTDKEDKEKHGMGLINIKNAAKKYHGGLDWSAENKVFTLTVMLQNETDTFH